jgi:transglutaminase-like putative cysteine protease
MRKGFIIQTIIGIGLTLPLTAFGQTDFSITKISPALMADADAVVRLDETSWEIKSQSEAIAISRLVVTIFNEKGEDEHGRLTVGYDKFTKIVDISGALYDASGKQIKKLKNSEIEDYGYGGAAGDEITDARVKLASFGKKSYAYPYTIEYVHETRNRNMMFYPKWTPSASIGSAVERSVYKIKAPAGFKFRYKEYNGAPAVVKSKDADGADLYVWMVENQAARRKNDTYPLPAIERTPMVMVAPADFEVQDYKGNFNTWGDFGKFYHTLNAGRDALPPATVSEIQTVIKPAKTDREKAELIYKWMQARSRYVSIQLGIGGWQTIDAMTVAKTGYGDCKALTNFTLAALKSAGINCYAALIRAGEEEKMKADFPSNQFNHVIACALVDKDTLWLECTSQTTKPNFMGTFTGSRYALLVTPEGGKLVQTPDYRANQNVRDSRANVTLAESGDGAVEVKVLYTGLQHETRAMVMHQGTKEEQKKWLLNHINLPSLDLQRFELTEGQDKEPSVTEKLSLNVRNCATKTGTRLFVKPTLLSRPFDLPAITERTTDFYLPLSDFNFTDLDTVSYQVPTSYKLETTLPAFQISSAFGSYELKTTFDNNKLICSRKVVMNGGRYESKDFAAWIDFVKKVRKADRVQVVFVENKL